MPDPTINSVYPWGRGMDEYIAMFALTPNDFRAPILDCGSGPSSFNAQMTQAGHRVVSCDPLYRFSAPEIRRRIAESSPGIMDNVRNNPNTFAWHTIKSPEHLLETRMTAMERFLADYPQGAKQGRYVLAQMPHLPFRDSSFGLAVVSHLLFLYSEALSAEFHLRSILELLRVAREVRIFPLLALGGIPSAHFEPVTQSLATKGCKVETRQVAYEFLKGATSMLCVRQ